MPQERLNLNVTDAKLAEVIAQIAHFAVDNERQQLPGTTRVGLIWMKLKEPHRKNEAWKFLSSAAYIIACFIAQNTKRGHLGVDMGVPFERLEMWRLMPLRERFKLALTLIKNFQEEE